jgi:hypothetical protein
MKRQDHQIDCQKAAVVIALVGMLTVLPAQTTNFSVSAAPPDWVRTVEWTPATQRLTNRASEGTRYLLYERQEHPQKHEEFMRIALRMENETGVQDSGSLSLSFDPSYQELILHRIQIHRGGQVLDRLEPAKIKIIQPEPGLDDHLFTGRKNALIFIEDLRVGDVLEYAYTKRGSNPILDDHFSTRYVIQSGRPVDRQRLRLVWPTTRPLHQRQHLTTTPAKESAVAGGTEYVWDSTNLTAIAYEDYLPAGFARYPYVELSDFEDWAEVVKWALPLYEAGNTNLPPELGKLLVQWQHAATTVEEQARLALQFVQDDVRYTGLELGPDSYRPTPPAETFQKRFGDCKGKSLLFCAILRALGLEAWPALVNSTARASVADRLPSPFAFDHVIVKLRLGGETVWLDPTISHQGGRLEDRVLPTLPKALVIQPEVSALEDIPPPVAASSRQQVTTTFVIKDYVSPVTFTVATTYRGSGADQFREEAARADLQELSKDYLNFYARHYPGVQSPLPLKISDDRTNNVLTVTENYEIKDLWKLDATSHQWEAEFHAESLQEVLTDPTTRLRTMPLRITFPIRREQEIIVHLPEKDWQIPALRNEVQHEAFAFHYRRALSGNVLRFHYEVETKLPEVPANQVAGYLEKREAMENLLSDTLQRPNRSSGSVLARLNWLMVVIALFGMTATSLICLWGWRATRAREALPPPFPEELQFQGLGGWLILVGFGLCAGPLLRCANIAKNWEGFFSLDSWQAVALPHSDQYHPLYAPLLIFEILGFIFLLGLNLLTIALFFSRCRMFPNAYIALIVSNALFLLVDEIVGNAIPLVAGNSNSSSGRAVFGAFLTVLIWGSYMFKSRRVKATFRE